MRTKKSLLLKILLVVIVGGLLFASGYAVSRSQQGPKTLEQAAEANKNYYVSFDDYYYEVPENKAVDDKLVLGGQFVYNLNAAIKINTLDDLFNGGAIGVQSLVPLYGDSQAFETYVNTVAKPTAASDFQGGAEASFADRDSDKTRTAELIIKKDDQVIRRQTMVNLPQAVAVVTKEDSKEYKQISKTAGQASAAFSDYEAMKLQVLAASFMLNNKMFDDIYRLAHDGLRGAASVEDIKSLAERSKDALALGGQVTGVEIKGQQMTATVHFVDSSKPANNKTGLLTFKRVDGNWKLYGLKLPGGSVSGPSEDAAK